MTDHRYPTDLVITRKDFADSGWDVVLNQTPLEGYYAMSQALSVAERKAIHENRNEHGKVLWLLADVCSMMLSPSSQNEPFKPSIIFTNGRRTAIPDDLTATDVEFFAEIAETVTDIRLRARLADLVWLKGKPRNVKFALMAIDAYRDIPLDAETWVHDGEKCWERAISLAQMIKVSAGDRLEQMETHIVASFNAERRQDAFLGLWLARLLKTNGWGRLHQTDIAQKLETLAREFDGESNVCNARKYFSASADWYRIVPD